jgi:hypothetical protein
MGKEITKVKTTKYLFGIGTIRCTYQTGSKKFLLHRKSKLHDARGMEFDVSDIDELVVALESVLQQAREDAQEHAEQLKEDNE